ncbi:MAG: Flp pilus assembly protein CpaB [Alphaproteobacteria bacterium]
MRGRSLIVLVLGVVVALGVAMSLHSRMQHADTGPGAPKVLVASGDIAPGSFVHAPEQLAFTDWPQSDVAPSMLLDTTTKLAEFDGAVARRAITKGEPITEGMLVKSNEGGFMSAVLEPGKRAVSIAVDSQSGNAGFIFPGDHVDLILTHSVSQQGQQVRASETFIEDARVLAVDQMLTNPDNKAVLAKTVTLEVTPKQAEEINVAKDLGKISLSLRSLASAKPPVPAAPAELPPNADLDDVLKAVPDTAPPPEDNHVTRDTDVSKILTPQGLAGSVRVLHGNTQEVVQFNDEPSGSAGSGGGNGPR